MKLTKIRVENYKALKEVEIPLSEFACVIGENNAGKSSLLQAISLLVSGTTLKSDLYFDPSQEIRIALTIEDISDLDLQKLEEGHRTKIEGILHNKSLVLVRKYGTDGKSSLKYEGAIPTELRFQPENIAELLKGLKASSSSLQKVLGVFPELAGKVTAASNQGQFKEAITALADALPPEMKVSSDRDLPTGIDKSIVPLLPEPIYIPAVKDFGDDIKTKEGTPFGKVLRVLLQAIEPELSGTQQLFDELNSKLNRTFSVDGEIKDCRLRQVRQIESTVEKYVQESFANVRIELEVPPPEIKTVLSSTKIYADDGVRGDVDTKGDGLRRAVVFSILRAYVDLNRDGAFTDGDSVDERSNEYILLFEEPELYLHPCAQDVLFQALAVFSKRHSVVVTTHSPLFFGPSATATFVKMKKTRADDTKDKPFSLVHPVCLADVTAKDQFQMICFENNNSAFFSDAIVLVEGDSDFIVFPHLAELLRPGWNRAGRSVKFVRIGGKGSIARYRDFFSRFNSRVVIIADLDVLIDGFDKLGVSEESQVQRNALLKAIDQVLADRDDPYEVSNGRLNKLAERGDSRAKWMNAKLVGDSFSKGEATFEQLGDAIEAFFSIERSRPRMEVLENCRELPEIQNAKFKLLKLLREENVIVLAKGDIEKYYPAGLVGHDKPSQAQDFCRKIRSKDEALELCVQDLTARDGTGVNEFELIIETIVGDLEFKGSGTK